MDGIHLPDLASFWFSPTGLREAIPSIPSELIWSNSGWEKLGAGRMEELSPIVDYSIPYLSETKGDWERERIAVDLKWFAHSRVNLTGDEQEGLRRKFIELVLLQVWVELAFGVPDMGKVTGLIGTYPLAFPPHRVTWYRESLRKVVEAIAGDTDIRVDQIVLQSESMAGFRYTQAVAEQPLILVADLGGGTTDTGFIEVRRVESGGELRPME